MISTKHLSLWKSSSNLKALKSIQDPHLKFREYRKLYLEMNLLPIRIVMMGQGKMPRQPNISKGY